MKFVSLLLALLISITLTACNSATDDLESESPSDTYTSSIPNATDDSEEEIDIEDEEETSVSIPAPVENTPADETENSAVPEGNDTPASETDPTSSANTDIDEDEMINVSITIDGTSFLAKFHNNESAQALISQMPFSLDMDDYARQEKVSTLPFSMPNATTATPATINKGDIYIWSGNSLVLFYTTFSNSYSYIPIGYIEDTTGLTAALGSGSATVTFNKAQ